MSKALQMIDQFINEIKSAPSSSSSPAATAFSAVPAQKTEQKSASVPTPTCSSVPSSCSSSSSNVYGGVIGDDIAWFPITPVGHTVYSWVGEDGEHIKDPFLSPFPAGSPFQTTAPGASSKGAAVASSTTTPASTPAPASSSTPAPAAAAPSKSGKEEKKENNKKNDNKKPEKKEEKPAAGKKDDKKKIDPAVLAALEEEEKAQSGTPLIARIDIRVGKIVSIKNHPKADRLYIEEIDVGEDKPRQVLSGLRQNIPIEELQGTELLVICNFLPAKMQGENSYGMVLAASSSDKKIVELVKPPAGAKPGERVTIDGVDVKAYRPDKDIDGRMEGSVWQRFAEKLLTNDDGVATFDGKPIKVSTGECKVKSLKNVKIA